MLPLSLRVSAYGLCAVAGHGKVVLSGATFFYGDVLSASYFRI
ncbi:hypothetical protein HMPREF3033_00338 [Veillonellaceae bacterium DNF00751]|uniref:Uncharacterized protein n=1 Tax=Megasphaera lornae TaxID=1000568 RepID=D3LUX2_9FIRM|nr:hypothetical protein HMPREF0889_1671 [Megasphaera genomosp. type_1 str. 28L]EGL39795.1 hypothetical protein HMPREF1039_0976 [Megasphaera lornae]KXB93362.1 hypothetical protein HMPREF3033_00338 [Veillonellaceae bacterium DNF00751]